MQPANKASEKVAVKNGYVKEGRNKYLRRKVLVDLIYFLVDFPICRGLRLRLWIFAFRFYNHYWPVAIERLEDCCLTYF